MRLRAFFCGLALAATSSFGVRVRRPRSGPSRMRREPDGGDRRPSNRERTQGTLASEPPSSRQALQADETAESWSYARGIGQLVNKADRDGRCASRDPSSGRLVAAGVTRTASARRRLERTLLPQAGPSRPRDRRRRGVHAVRVFERPESHDERSQYKRETAAPPARSWRAAKLSSPSTDRALKPTRVSTRRRCRRSAILPHCTRGIGVAGTRPMRQG